MAQVIQPESVIHAVKGFIAEVGMMAEVGGVS